MWETVLLWLRRVGWACCAFWWTLTDDRLLQWLRRERSQPLASPAPPSEPVAPHPPPLRAIPTDAALQLLGLLQQEGRLIDFLEEEVATFSDADIGGAARVVHEGCRKALRSHVHIAPIRPESEGDRVTLEAGFDASAVRLTGRVVGQPPFTGTLVHRGWRATDVRLPTVTAGHDVTILAPAEVEL